jgi:peptidyl-prolyl cis-trans isomerase C
MKLFALAASAAYLCAQGPQQSPIINGLPPATVVARADGKPITAGEIRSLLETGDPSMINLAKLSPEYFLGSVFVMRFLAAEGEKINIADQSPYKEQLEAFRSRVILSAMVNRIRETYVVQEQEINDFYAHNQSRYEQAWIKVITVGFCPSLTQQMGGTSDEDLRKAAAAAFGAAHCTSKYNEEQARAKAVELVGQLRAGADFVKLVGQYSDDTESKATAGDFGLITRDGHYPQEIKTAVFSLKPGEVSDPVRSGMSFYIIKIKEKTVQPLSAVQEPIVQELKQKHFTDWMEGIQHRFKPVIERPDFFTKQTPAKPAGPAQLVPQPE